MKQSKKITALVVFSVILASSFAPIAVFAQVMSEARTFETPTSGSSGSNPSAALSIEEQQAAARGVVTGIQNQYAAEAAALAAAKAAQDAQLLAAQQALAAQQVTSSLNTSSSSDTGMANLIGACGPLLNSRLGGSSKTVKEANDAMDTVFKAREAQGYRGFQNVDQNLAREIGAAADTTMAKGCNYFMNKEGKTQVWGDWAMQLIQDKPEAFQKAPDDIAKWCPKFYSMSKDQKNLFWVWTLMAMASSESTCNPSIKAKGIKDASQPGGHRTAYGLFQLEYKNGAGGAVCPKASNLLNAEQNITCAVDQLAKELTCRPKLMAKGAATERAAGSCATYWGVLRDDDNNSARGGDIKGAQKTRAIIKQYKYCN